ncbi:MAG: hypothetical protein HQM09_23905 [Candidatus Riflebacteria bacterium]|nr:hypothetical protein [Candidatus Riflebacteria bacterium]
METRRPLNLPEALQSEISLYMSEGEKIIDAISSASGPVGKLGELWMIITDRTLFFYTREFGKNPVVALISRADVKMATYSQTPTGVTLTFQPRNHPLNTVRVPFPIGQLKEVNRVCEELSKSMPFEMVSDKSRLLPGKTASPTSPVTSAHTSKPTSLRAIPGGKDSQPPEWKASDQSAKSSPTPPPAPTPATSSARPAPATPPFVPPVVPPSVTQPVKSSAPPAARIPATATSPASPGLSSGSATDIRINLSEEAVSYRFVALASLISLLVAYIWYRLFVSLSDRN